MQIGARSLSSINHGAGLAAQFLEVRLFSIVVDLCMVATHEFTVVAQLSVITPANHDS